MTKSKTDALSESTQRQQEGYAPPPTYESATSSQESFATQASSNQSQPFQADTHNPPPQHHQHQGFQQQPPPVVFATTIPHQQLPKRFAPIVASPHQTVLTFSSTSTTSSGGSGGFVHGGSAYSFYQPAHVAPVEEGQPLLLAPQTIVIDTTDSVLMFCPHCQANCQSVVENTPGCLAWLTSAFLCLVGLGCCFFVPLVAPRCQDQVHKCPGCRRVLAIVPA